MPELSLEYFKARFQKLRVGITKFGNAPHKPVLLISLIEIMERGLVSENRFEVTPELVAEFKENWLYWLTLKTFAISRFHFSIFKEMAIGKFCSIPESNWLFISKAFLRWQAKLTMHDLMKGFSFCCPKKRTGIFF